MATDIGALREYITSGINGTAGRFAFLKELSALAAERPEDRAVQELVLRALEKRGELQPFQEVIDSLVRQQGLFPYLDPSQLKFQDRLAYEFHRPMNLPPRIVFHRVQAEIYRLLLAGDNVVLSAPTSFGKSLIVDAMVASGKYRNIVIVVPTIALIDETRRRLIEGFKDRFNIITHAGQQLGETNIFVLTQERVVEYPNLPKPDFFVIDEFYKLDPRQDPDRANLLNQAFYNLFRTGAQFYMLGPNIQEIPTEFRSTFRCRFISTDYATVVTEVTRVQASRLNRLEKLVELCKTLDEPTLIYCSSPGSTRKVATALLGGGVGRQEDGVKNAVQWISEEFHPSWVLPTALERGVGIHHGKVPRAIAQFMVRAFNSESIKYLVCTSTLIEGVNTKAKNVVIYDTKLSRQPLDYFTFNNIKGRSGRMFEHFIGKVYLFGDPPQESLPMVDVPLISQQSSAPDSLLVQMEQIDLTPVSQERMSHVWRQEALSVDAIRENRGLDPGQQIRLAEELEENAQYYNSRMAWRGMPTYEELTTVSTLIWDYFIPDNRMRSGVASGKQLAFKINRLRSNPRIADQIRLELSDDDDDDIDMAVEGVLDFLRYWANYSFPRYLAAVDRIQRDVFTRNKLPVGDYSAFGQRVESYFLPAGIAALEEYGIPIQLGERLANRWAEADSVDRALDLLRRMNLRTTSGLRPFERDLIRDAQKYL